MDKKRQLQIKIIIGVIAVPIAIVAYEFYNKFSVMQEDYQRCLEIEKQSEAFFGPGGLGDPEKCSFWAEGGYKDAYGQIPPGCAQEEGPTIPCGPTPEEQECMDKGLMLNETTQECVSIPKELLPPPPLVDSAYGQEQEQEYTTPGLQGLADAAREMDCKINAMENKTGDVMVRLKCMNDDLIPGLRSEGE